jgi:predicted metal-dependent phosphoesterase TrpH
VGRPHIANVLVDEGYVYSFQDAFNRFLGDGKPASIEKPKIEIQRAVSLIKAAGGVCSIAHPGLMLNDSDLQLLIQAGTNAIEVVHPNHSAEQVRHYSQLARSNGLIETGGSDFHGGRKGEETLGKYKVPYEVVTQLKELARNHR